MKVLIWGTGQIAQDIASILMPNCVLLGFIDNNLNKKCFYNKFVYSPIQALEKMKYDYIIIASNFADEIYTQIKNEYNVPKNKILFVTDTGMQVLFEHTVYNSNSILSNLVDLPRLKDKWYFTQKQFLHNKMHFDNCNKSILTGKSNIYHIDYTRYRTFELCADELSLIDSSNTAVSEVGVFTGTFAAIINEKFPNHNLYLFDTFASFDPHEYNKAMEHEGSDVSFFYETFKYTSIDTVISKMPFEDKCIIKQGYFPETAADCEDLQFCFVSIDVDLYESTYNSLKFFYPRLIKGGYIFVHDYNSVVFTGCKKAIKKYEEEFGQLAKVPVSDTGGTIIITK